MKQYWKWFILMITFCAGCNVMNIGNDLTSNTLSLQTPTSFPTEGIPTLEQELSKIPTKTREDTVLTVTQEISTAPAEDVENHSLLAAQGMSSTSIIQNMSFANLSIDSENNAFIKAGSVHPNTTSGEVMLEWFLYAWNQGSTDWVTIRQNVRITGIGYVEVNERLSVPYHDYYLLECRNKIVDEKGAWIPINISESRFSRIAPMNGIWERTGEVTSDSAVLHTYLTEKPPFDATELENLRVPPMAGYAQFIVYRDPGMQEKAAESGFYPVDDYIWIGDEWRRINYNFRWTVTGLEPDTTYYYRVETKSSDGLDLRVASNINSFKTSPAIDADQPVSFVVAHCLDVNNTVYTDPLESADRGLKVFASMLSYADNLPDFIIMEGDTVYYDGGAGYSPDVGSYSYASYTRRWLYWYAQYQFSNLMYFFQQIPGYWMVDDHDYWGNNINEYVPDGWYIFRNANPTPGDYGTTGENATGYYNDNPDGTSQGEGSKYWRAVRWGQHVEIFLEEGRNHRDADAGLIWGDEQRQWLEQKIRESSATFKIIAVTTPLIGPVVSDDMYPSVIPDKHVNDKFRAETELFLKNIRDVENVYIIAGDRHYKYHGAINNDNFPQLSQFNEFGSGSAAGPPHAIPGSIPDSDFARMVFSDGLSEFGPSAGYLRVEVVPQPNGVEIIFKLIRVTEDLDNEVVYSWSFTANKPEQ